MNGVTKEEIIAHVNTEKHEAMIELLDDAITDAELTSRCIDIVARALDERALVALAIMISLYESRYQQTHGEKIGKDQSILRAIAADHVLRSVGVDSQLIAMCNGIAKREVGVIAPMRRQ